jgi:3-dehydroquinate synthase
MRGVEWEYLPTTLLAMVDSCIGGKSSINVGPYKNLVGTFHPPTHIRIDPRLVETLPTEAKLSGLLEACKICFCRGSNTFVDYLSLQPSPTMGDAQIQGVIELSLSAKKWFIEIDEFDQADRLLLNFGHTFGHAIEAASDFRVAHGIAVGIGMLCALELGQLLGRKYSGSKGVAQLNSHVRELLGGAKGLSGDLGNIRILDILDRFEADKKHGSSEYTVVLVTEAGAVGLEKLAKSKGAVTAIQSAISNVLAGLSANHSRQVREQL